MASLYGQGVKNPDNLITPRAIFANQCPRSVVGRFALTTANIVGDKLYIGKLPSSAIMLPASTIVHDALGASVTLNVGFEETPGAAVNCLGAALAVGGAAGTKAGMAAVSLANMTKRIWELAGLTANPGRDMTLIATIAGATITGTPGIYFNFLFVDER